MIVDRGFVNVITLSVGFMLVFSAFQTMGTIEPSVLESIHKEDPSFTGKGYTSLAIIYAVFASCNWLAPSFISLTGPRITILTGAFCYIFFIATFLWPSTNLLYIASALVGVGAALIWTGHGQYLTENSDVETMTRNAGLFWAIFQLSLFGGNLCAFFAFTEEEIQESKRRIVFQVLTSLAVIGGGVLLLMKSPPQNLVLGEAEGVSSADKELRIPEKPREKPLMAAWHAIRDAFVLFITPQILLLSLTFIYTGLELTFFSSVYSSSIGFTEGMGESRKRYIPLSGICIGIGEVLGGAIFGILGTKRTKSLSGWPVVGAGFVMHLFVFLITLLNLPNNAPFKDTNDVGFIAPSPALALVGSLILGFGDACFNTQIYSLLGVLYSKESAPAFALFKFCQSVAAAVSFFYSTYIGLHFQLAILFITVILGTGAFAFVDLKNKRAKNAMQSVIDTTQSDESCVSD